MNGKIRVKYSLKTIGRLKINRIWKTIIAKNNFVLDLNA